MALTLITDATQEPVTVSETKAYLRLDSDAEDQLVNVLIKAARQWIEGQTHRCLLAQTWDLDIDWDWPYSRTLALPRIEFPVNPVSSVTSIVYEDGTSPKPTLASSQYTVLTRKYGSYIVPAYGITWPTVLAVPSAITVRFVAGESSVDNVPEALKLAIKMLAAHLYERRDLAMDKAFVEIPFGLEALLSPYRHGRVG